VTEAVINMNKDGTNLLKYGKGPKKQSHKFSFVKDPSVNVTNRITSIELDRPGQTSVGSPMQTISVATGFLKSRGSLGPPSISPRGGGDERS
jgi:hypothetical protein